MTAAVRRVAGLFAVHNVRGDGQDGHRVDRTAVQRELRQRLIELLDLLTRDLIYAVIVIAELREIALDLEINDNAVLRIADGLYLGILDRGERIRHAAHARNAECHQAAHLGIMQRHLALLVGVLVVHVMDGVHRGNVGLSQPRTVEVHAAENLLIIQHIAVHDRHLRADLLELVLVTAAVDRHHHQLCDVGTRTEELHVLADAHRGYAARDGVIITVVRTHNIIVLVLQGIRVDRYLCDELLPVLRQVFAPQNGQIRLCGSVQVVQGVEHAVAILRNHVTTVLTDAADCLGDPHRVAAEQLVVLRRTQVTRHTQVQNEVVHNLLRLGLGHQTCLDIALKVDIEEGGGAAKAHCGAVLLLDAGQIAKVQPLNGLLCVLRRTGDIKAVGSRHCDHVLECLDLVGELLRAADLLFGGRHAAECILVLLLFRDQAVHAVQCNAAVVTDDSAAAVSIRQAGQQTNVTRFTNVLGICGEYAVVVGLVVLELLLNLGRNLIAVLLARITDHAHAAERIACTLERLIGLQADDNLVVLVEIARAEGRDGDNGLGVDITDTALFALLREQCIELLTQRSRACGSRSQKSAVTIIRGVILLDKVADIDLVFPVAAIKVVPCVHVLFLLFVLSAVLLW